MARLAFLSALVLLWPALSSAQQPKWGAADYDKAGELICAWKGQAGKEVVKVCEDLGFKVIGGSPIGKAVLCKWDGKLDADALKALRENDLVRFVEPNLKRYLSYSAEADALDVDKETLDAFAEAKEMICAWRPREGKELIEFINGKELAQKLTISGGDGKSTILCKWDGVLKAETLKQLVDHPSILYVEPNIKRPNAPIVFGETTKLTGVPVSGRKRSAQVPRDEFSLDDLWGLSNIGAPEAWDAVQASSVIVAVLDTGIDYRHKDLAGNVWQNEKESPDDGKDNDDNGAVDDIFGADFVDGTTVVVNVKGLPVTIGSGEPMDEHYHGTHVAGTIGAIGNNGVGVTGVCWRVKLLPVRVLGPNGGDDFHIARGIEYAVNNGAKVINMSLGGRGRTDYLADAIKYAQDHGVLVVCAAGNVKPDDAEADNDKTPEYPASYAGQKVGDVTINNILAVANIQRDQSLNPGSHFGAKSVHIAGPGTEILSTFPTTTTTGMDEVERKFGRKLKINYETISGTSMAAPHVAGAAALILGHPKFEKLASAKDGYLEVRKLILDNARPLSSLSGKCTSGATLDITFLNPNGPQPPPNKPQPPIVYRPPQPPIICYPPRYTCPQYRFRIFCRRAPRWCR